MVVFGPGFVWGDPNDWRYLWGDAGSGLAAFRYYVAEGWGFPLLQARGLNQPDGINVAFTDSLPLLALLAKVVDPFGLDPARWWGWWFLGLHVAQGATAAWAARAWGNRSPVVALSVATVAVSAPIFLLRTWHPGLAAQFLLLAAWAWVGELRSPAMARRRWVVEGGGALLAVAALLTHVYLLLGVLVVTAGGAVDLTASGRRSVGDAARWLAIVAGAVVSAAVVMGYFSAGAAEAQGYELFGMHLFGPVVAQQSWWWPGNEWTIQASGSFEAFNWLGFGWLGLLSVAGVAAVGRLRGAVVARLGDGVTRHQVLLAALAVLTAYAVTPMVRLWDDDPHDLRTPLGWVVADRSLHRWIWGVGLLAVVALGLVLARRVGSRWWPGLGLLGAATVALAGSILVSDALIAAITGQFRIAGRLFWVVSYGTLAVGGGLLGRLGGRSGSWSRRLMAVAALAVAAIQVVDVPNWRELAGATLDPTPERVARLDALAGLIEGADELVVEPAFNCADLHGGLDGLWTFQDVGIVASWDRTPTTRVYAARRADEPCDQPIAPVLAEGAVLVVVAPEAVTDELLVRDDDWTCRREDLVLACRAGG